MGSLKSYVWTTSTTRWKSLLRTPRLWAPFRGSNHQSSCSQWEKWMIWPICWVVSLWWKPALFWSTFGNTIGKYFQCISFSGTLMLTRNDLGNVFQYSCMETREFITKKNGILVLSLQGAFGFGSSKRAAELGENLRAFGEGIPLNFLRTGFQTRILIAVCPKECLGRKIVLLMWYSTPTSSFTMINVYSW